MGSVKTQSKFDRKWQLILLRAPVGTNIKENITLRKHNLKGHCNGPLIFLIFPNFTKGRHPKQPQQPQGPQQPQRPQRPQQPQQPQRPQQPQQPQQVLQFLRCFNVWVILI